MSKNLTTMQYFWLFIVTLLLSSLTVSVGSSATLHTEDATRRADMLAISDGYVKYKWTATTDNRWHIDDGLHNQYNVDTPDIGWCNTHPIAESIWGCWDLEPIENFGVPYFWGGSTAIENPDLHLNPHDMYDAPNGTKMEVFW